MPSPIRPINPRPSTLSLAEHEPDIDTPAITSRSRAPHDSREASPQTDLHIESDFSPSRAILRPESRQEIPTAITPEFDGLVQLPILTQLSDEMRVGGSLDFTRCTRLTSLPNDVADWGSRTDGASQITGLQGAVIFDNPRQRLMQASPPNMQFHLGPAPTQSPYTRFARLSEAVDFWHSLAPGHTAPHLAAWKDILDGDLDLLGEFLDRLRETADYKHPGARTRLVCQVCDMLKAMDESSALRRECSDRISDAVQACNDRVVWVMNQVEVAIRVHKSMHIDGGPGLRNFILSLMRLDIVQKHARWKCETLESFDEIEVFLAYESGLRQKLELPVSAENMLYASVAQVTPEDLEMAEKAVRTAMEDAAQVDDYFQKSGPWQRHLRHEAAKCWSWESMPPEPWPEGLDTKELQCAITQEHFSALKQPVLCPYFNTWHVYEAQDLIRYWIECGQDTLGQRLELAALKRPIKQA